jgi:hypothetical protein
MEVRVARHAPAVPATRMTGPCCQSGRGLSQTGQSAVRLTPNLNPKTPTRTHRNPTPHPTPPVLFFSMGAVWLPDHAAFCSLLIWAASLLGAEASRWVRHRGLLHRWQDGCFGRRL